jgi:polyisoprenoid-binding protein YceI
MPSRVPVIAFALMALAAVSFLTRIGHPLDSARADAPAAPLTLTGTWVPDPAHTNVVFSIQHLGISIVRGRFDDFAGTIVADADHPEKSSVQFTIQTAGIDTSVKMRDDDLRSSHYFDAANYPTITFVSTKVDKGRHGDYVAHGDLTIHGVTKHIALPFTINGPIHDPFGGVRFGVLAHITLNRSDFGVGGQNILPTGAPAIGNDVDVDISLEAVPPKAPK